MASRQLQPNIDLSCRFLRSLGSAPRVLVAIQHDTGGVYAATPRTRDTLAAFLIESFERGANIYFTPNRTRGALTRKPKKPDIKWFDFAQVDLDPPEHHQNLPDWQAHVFQLLRHSKWPPTVAWVTGNGVQALWAIRDPVLLDRDDAIRDCENRNRGLLEHFQDSDIKASGTWNIDRILRVPGTINFPDAKKRAAGRTVERAGNVQIF